MFKGAVYFRVGDGNKLVRDPKAPSRVGLSQRAKWTYPNRTPVHVAMWALRNTRYHRLKEPYCQVLTRYGRCDKTKVKDPFHNNGMQTGVLRGAVYFRVGDGNKLVRLSKPPVRSSAVVQKAKWIRPTRSPAVQKARWTLHNARYRRRKQYCQFFTRFGKCDKGEGKCPFIHDADKVAVCTQFLKGTCKDTNCPLTHKAIPERMSDCLYFLQGLCTNEECPYRHVKVNAKASICEKFLKGYCADGDNCNHKHTYVCPVYAETGNCPHQATCKLHHPKRKEAAVQEQIGLRRKRRQFGCDGGAARDTGLLDTCEDGQLSKRLKLFSPPQQASVEEFLAKVHDGTSDLEKLIKPAFLLSR